MESVILKPQTDFRFDKRKNGWELIENVLLADNQENKLFLHSFLNEGENYVSGEKMLKRAKKMGDLAGQLHAERILTQADTIPDEWKKYFLLFPGTVWRGSDGDLRVPYLGWRGGEWCLLFGWLVSGFRSHCRLVRLS